MANTVEDLDKQIADLELKKKAILETSKNDTIKSIKALIAQYNLTAKDLDLKPVKKTTKSKPLYANPDDKTQTWTGKGRQPNWVASYLALGKTLESALIK